MANENSCIACKESIKQGASKCPKCQAYQSAWRNRLPSIGAITAILAFIGSSLVVVTAIATDLFESLLWRDEVSVISYSSNGPTVVQNSGSGSVFLEDVFVESKQAAYRSSTRLGQTAEKDSFVSIDKSQGQNFGVVDGVSDAEWQAMIKGEVQDVIPHIYSSEHRQLATLRAHLGNNLRTFRAECKLFYRSVRHPNAMEEEFPCTGILVRVVDSGVEFEL